MCKQKGKFFIKQQKTIVPKGFTSKLTQKSNMIVFSQKCSIYRIFK